MLPSSDQAITPQNTPSHSFGYDVAVCAAKRIFRNEVLFRLDDKLPFHNIFVSHAKNLGQKIEKYTHNVMYYDQLANLGLEKASLKAGPKALFKTARSNVSNIRFAKNVTPGSYLKQTVLCGNASIVSDSLLKGRIFEAGTRLGFMGLAASDVVSKVNKSYEQSHSILNAGKTFIKEGTKAAINWEAGTVGALAAEALIPALELAPALRIVGMAVVGVGTKHLLDSIC